MTESNNQFGDWLRSAREELGLTQDELGERVGVKKQHISNLERGEKSSSGKVARPSYDLAMKLASVFNWSASELLEMAGLKKNEQLSQPAETVEEVLRSAFLYGGKPFSDEEIAQLRPYMEMLDREIDRVRAISKGQPDGIQRRD